MKRLSFVLTMALVLGLAATIVQADPRGNHHGFRVAAFVDEDGDGFNDLAPDADGDGIPNGLDSDYERPQNGSGPGFGRPVDNPQGLWSGLMDGQRLSHYFFWGPFGPFALEAPGQGYGPGEGTGFGGEGPADGTGFGPGSGTGNGTGDCDGTGPNGQQGAPPDRGSRR